MTNLPNFTTLSALLTPVVRIAGAVRSLTDTAISATARIWVQCPLSTHAPAVTLVQYIERYYRGYRVVASFVNPSAVASALKQLDAVESHSNGMPALRISLDQVRDPRLGFSEETVHALAAGEIVSLPGRSERFNPYKWLEQLGDDRLAALFPAGAYDVAFWLAEKIEGRRVVPNGMLDTLAGTLAIREPLFKLAKHILSEEDGYLILFSPALVWPFRFIKLSKEAFLVWPDE